MDATTWGAVVQVVAAGWGAAQVQQYASPVALALALAGDRRLRLQAEHIGPAAEQLFDLVGAAVRSGRALAREDLEETGAHVAEWAGWPWDDAEVTGETHDALRAFVSTVEGAELQETRLHELREERRSERRRVQDLRDSAGAIRSRLADLEHDEEAYSRAVEGSRRDLIDLDADIESGEARLAHLAARIEALEPAEGVSDSPA